MKELGEKREEGARSGKEIGEEMVSEDGWVEHQAHKI